jgi:hypothetical protein
LKLPAGVTTLGQWKNGRRGSSFSYMNSTLLYHLLFIFSCEANAQLSKCMNHLNPVIARTYTFLQVTFFSKGISA